MTQNRKWFKRGVYGLLLLIFVILLIWSGWKAANVKVREREAVLREQQLTEKRDELQDELTRIDTDEYVIDKARSVLRMIFPGETLYIINPDPNADVFLEEKP